MAGQELWSSDGTAAGTVLAADIYPGTTSSNPAEFTFAGSTVLFAATDGSFGRELWSFDVNKPPLMTSITGPPAPIPLGDSAQVTASFSDPNPTDTHTCDIDWGDGDQDTGVLTTTAQSCEPIHTYSEPGVYGVTVTVKDSHGETDSQVFEFVVVYDPDGGFVTGGGWITSPAGAYKADEILTGKANFGFVSKYKKGATVPTGQTQFQFKTGDLNFHSTSYDWLVIGGAQAQHKGLGTINGEGSFRFMLTAKDSAINGGPASDTFRIRIWNNDAGEGIVYDNGTDQTLGGGSIVIHTKEK
jgi:ELWxxDGT repeat protein